LMYCCKGFKCLKIESISSTEVEVYLGSWYPASNDDVFICGDLEIGFSDNDDGTNLFYVTLATPEALRKNAQGFLLADNKTLVVSGYSYGNIVKELNNILKKCSRKDWEQSCEVLRHYFQWEYEDYVSDDLN